MKENKNNSIFEPSVLTLGDLPWLQEMGEIEDGIFKLERNRAGRKLRTPVSVPVDQILSVGQKGLVKFIMDSLVPERPKLVPFAFKNQGLIDLAEYLLRYRSGSPSTFYLYTNLIEHFSKWVGKTPDEIVADVKYPNGLPNPEKVQIHAGALGDYVAHLQDNELAPNRVANYVRAVKVLYKVNGIRLDLPYSLPRRVVRKDRAPTPEELLKLLEIANLRERVIISMGALGGFREGTLAKLRYRHVKHDLEEGIVPVHVHVEAEITKGKYHDYDTFLGKEAASYIKLYLDTRRRGSLEQYTRAKDGEVVIKGLPPEEITDESPLIKDSRFRVPKPIGEKQIYQMVHGLYFKAGLLKRNLGRIYDLKVHSIRKYFKTQLMAAGIQPDYIDYMMGHTIDTYHDIQMKGVEFLRRQYANANLEIRPAPKISPVEQLKAFARELGLDPERVILERDVMGPTVDLNHQKMLKTAKSDPSASR